MLTRDERLLRDIVGACEWIIGFMQSTSRQAFLSDALLQSGVAYQLVIIGEASGHLSSEVRDRHDDIPWKAIRGLRNVVTHEYRRLDLDTLYITATAEVPELLQKILNILRDGPKI